MTPPITIVECTARVSVLGHLDEYERLAKVYIEERFPYDRRLLELLRLSDFILWLRQRQRQSVAGGSNDRN